MGNLDELERERERERKEQNFHQIKQSPTKEAQITGFLFSFGRHQDEEIFEKRKKNLLKKRRRRIENKLIWQCTNMFCSVSFRRYFWFSNQSTSDKEAVPEKKLHPHILALDSTGRTHAISSNKSYFVFDFKVRDFLISRDKFFYQKIKQKTQKQKVTVFLSCTTTSFFLLTNTFLTFFSSFAIQN